MAPSGDVLNSAGNANYYFLTYIEFKRKRGMRACTVVVMCCIDDLLLSSACVCSRRPGRKIKKYVKVYFQQIQEGFFHDRTD